MTNEQKKNFIEFQHVGFTYAKTSFSLEDINLAVSGSGLTLLRGINGSGKSTLCKLIVGLLKPETGKIFIDGADSAEMSLGERGSKIGYLFQNPSQQIFAPEVDDELCFIPRLLGWEEERIKARRDELIAFFGLEKLLGSPTFQLSRGEKQRLALAGILFFEPPFLILDEPTTGLDEENREKLAGLLQKLLAEGKGILLISHDAPFVASLGAYESIEMHDGRVN